MDAWYSSDPFLTPSLLHDHIATESMICNMLHFESRLPTIFHKALHKIAFTRLV